MAEIEESAEEINIEWTIDLENVLLEGCDFGTLRNICRGRPVPSELRSKVWQICLNVASKGNQFSLFEELYDLPEQSIIREDCLSVVDKLGNEEDEKLSVSSDLESIITLYCKARNIKYEHDCGWIQILQPMLVLKYTKAELYNIFYAILLKYIPRECVKNGKPFHLFRLLLLYHDPELCSFLDTKRISPESYAHKWFATLFSSHCDLRVILIMWDVYLQQTDQFLIFFLALVIIVNVRDQILSMETSSTQEVTDKLSTFPSALEADDIEDFCSLAQYYASKTPQSFRQDFQSVLFGTTLAAHKADVLCDINQTLTLCVSVDELLQINRQLTLTGDSVRYFLVDCRPAEQYNAGHLPTAFHLDANLMLQNPCEFATAVEALFATQQAAIASNSLAGGEHLAFLGSGREQEDQYTHMVIANFLQRHSQYVSSIRGGFQALHDAVCTELNEALTDHNPRSCVVCNSDSSNHNGYDNYDMSQHNEDESLINKFEKLSSVVKSKSAIVKEKMINYIKNEQQQQERHVSSSDKVGRRYRNMASVFTIGDDDEDETNEMLSSDDENREVINTESWMNKSDVKMTFECQEVSHTGNAYPSYLCVSDSHMYVLREIPHQKGMAWLQNSRSLSTILKITSKKRHSEFITFKYGNNDRDKGLTVTALDRFIIPKAGDATKFIKQQIMTILDAIET